jgi:uncharacterized delta-60 repeat protein
MTILVGEMIKRALERLLSLSVALASVALVGLVTNSAFAMGGAVEWSYNVAVIGKQEARAAAVDSTGAIVMAGYAEATSSNYHLAKILPDGSGLAWPAQDYDAAGGQDVATAVAVDGNDDILVTGYVHNGSNYDIRTVKYSGVDGSIIWSHNLDGAGAGNDFAVALSVDSLDNVYVGGTSQDASGKDDMIVVKYLTSGPNPDGSPAWQATYNSPDDGHDRLSAIAVGVDSIAVCGASQTATADFDFSVVKFDLAGAVVWQQRVSDAGDGRALDLAIDGNGDVVATGYVDHGAGRDHYTIKFPSAEGAALWSRSRDRGYDDEGRALWLDAANNVYVTGTSFDLASNKDLTVTRYAAVDGADSAPFGWHVDYNSANGNDDVGIDISGSVAGDLFVTSISNDHIGGFDDIYSYKFSSSSGARLWQQSYGSLPSHDRPVGLVIAPDGNPVVAGWSDSVVNGYDFIAVKYNAGALDAPTSLTATAVSVSAIDLVWTDNSTNEDNFVLERRNGSGAWTVVTASLPAATVTFSDTGLTADHRYTYRVKAVNATDGSSPYSNEADARTTIINYDPPAWSHKYAGPASGDDEPEAIAVGPDDHPVVAGFTFSAEGGYDYYTIKLNRDDAATEQWSARYNDGDNESDFATALAIDSNDRVTVSGYASLYGGGASNTNDLYTLSYPAAGGGPTWAHQYNGPNGDDDRSVAVGTAVDSSDSVVVVGYGKNAAFDNDIYVVKYASDGTPQLPLWAATPFDRGGDDQPAAVAFDANGDIFAVGKSWNGSDYDYFVGKYSGVDGSLLWGGPRFYSGSGNSTDYASDLAVDANGDLYVTGYSVGSGGSGDIVTLKYSGATGSVMAGWPQLYDGGSYDTGVALGIDPLDGELLVAGTSAVAPGNQDVVVLRYATDGALQWMRSLDFTGSDEAAAAMSVDRTGVACVVASTDSGGSEDIVAVMFDHTGQTVGASVLDGPAGDLDYPVDVAVNRYGEAFVAGVTTNSGSNSDFIIFKVNSTITQAPTPLSATLLYTEVDLSWSDNTLNETGFRVERKTGSCADTGNFVPIAETAADAVGFVASGLNPGTPYCFRVQSFNDLGEMSRWATLDVQTVMAEPPANLVATAIDSTDILLEWDDTTVGETVFNLQRCEGSGCDFSTATNVALPPDSSSYLDADVCEGRTYRYRINAVKTGHWVTDYSPSSADVVTISIQAPGLLDNDWVSEAWVELKWQDMTPNETSFTVERCSGSACTDFSDLATLTSPSGNRLHLRMDEAAWNGSADEVRDQSPAANHAQAFAGATISLAGKYAAAGSFSGTGGYVATPLQIDQAASSTTGATFTAWTQPASLSAGDHFLFGTDNGGNDWGLLRNGGTWFIANGADDALVNTGIAATAGGWQHIAAVFDPLNGVTLYVDGALAWNSATIAFDEDSSPLVIGRRGSLDQDFFDGLVDEVAVFDRPLSAAEVTALAEHGLARFNDRSVTHSTSYRYRVRATKSAGCGWQTGASNTLAITTTPPRPQLISATADSANRISLLWSDNTTTEDRFVVERCTGSGCSDFSALPDLVGPDTFYLHDSSVCPGTDYRYRVVAVSDGKWSSAYSDEAAVATPSLATPAVVVDMVSEEQVDLSWPANSADLTGYKLSRCQGDAAFCLLDSNYTPLSTRAVLPSGALLMMPMDEQSWSGAPDEVNDIAGGRHGQAYGGATTLAGGRMQRAGSFNGTSGYVQTGLNIDQSSTTAGVTFEAWVYPLSNANSQYVLSTDNGGADWGFYQAGTRWGVIPGSGAHIPAPNVSVSLNAWQHIVVTFQPGVGTTLYKNGNQAIGTTTAIYYDPSDSDLVIGRQGIYNQGYFNGYIDNVVVYDRVLTAAEILQRYQDFSYSENGLLADTEYHYRVWPYKDATCASDGDYTQLQVRTLKPPAPSALSIAQKSTTRLDLSWSDLTTSETGYRVQWCEGTSCTFSSDPTVNSAVLGPDAQSYVDETVCQGQDYGYRVRAERDWLSDVDYTWVTDWTVVAGNSPGKAVADNFNAVALSESEVELTWSDNNSDEDAYLLQKCISNDAASCLVSDDASFIDLASSINPTLWLKMDEAAWGAVSNSAVGGTDAARYGNATPVLDGERGQVGQFDGNGDFLRVNHYAGINPTAGVTVSIWAKSAGISWDSDHSLMSKRDAYILSPVKDTGRMRFYIFRNGDTWRVVEVDPGVDITRWHQYTGSYDGTSISLYVDGVLRDSAVWPGAINTDTGYLDIGRDEGYSTADRNFGGWLDDALIFDHALSAAEIQGLFDGQIKLGVTSVDTGLTPATEYYYRLRAAKEATCPWPEEWSLKSATTVQPPAPTALAVASVNTTQIDTTWEDNSGSETGYRVQRCLGGGCVFAATPSAADSVLLPPDSVTYSDLQVVEGQQYSYRVRAERATAPAWNTAWAGPESVAAEAKRDPANLTASRVSESELLLSWDDSNSDESGFKVERCAGEGCTDFVEFDDLPGNGAESTNLVANGTIATGTFSPYSYSVTHPVSGQTVRALRLYNNNGSPYASSSAAMALKTDTDYVVTFEAWCDAGADIPLQSDLLPDTLPEYALMVSSVPQTFRVVFNSSNPDMLNNPVMRFFHYNPGRYIYVTNIKFTPPTRVAYHDVDSGLLPDTTYRYQVRSYKTAANSWQTSPTNIAEAATKLLSPTDLAAAANNTTEVALAWTDVTESETNSEVWRCEGAGCSDFARIAAVGPDMDTFVDDTVANDTDYRYKIAVRNDGLSNAGGGSWSHFAPVVIGAFKSNSYYQVTVPYSANMRSDFGDLRLYDEASERQLEYWISSSTAGVSATVWFKTRNGETVNLYYGNPSATDAGNQERFIVKYEFPGTVIDAKQWIEIDNYDAISQGDGLILSTTSNYSWSKALISKRTFNRELQWQLLFDLTIGPDTNGNSGDYFMLGWWLDQTTYANYNQFAHGLFWGNYALRTYEGTSSVYLGKSYQVNTDYQVKIATTATGASYWIRGGDYADWTLLQTLNNTTEESLRIGIDQYSQNATIHGITLTPSPENTVLGSEEINVRTGFGLPWVAADSNVVAIRTPAPVTPVGVIATALSDSEVLLTWSDNSDETRFDIERCVGNGCSDFTPLSSVAEGTTAYSDTGLTYSTEYRYRVRGYKAAFQPWYSAYGGPSFDTTFSPPAANLSAVALDSRMIQLNWDDLASDEDGYEIEVKVWNGHFIKTGWVPANQTFYIDTVGIDERHSYTYRVRPYRGNDRSPYSNEATATTPGYDAGDGTCAP